jgi:hypothetical protein
VRAKLHKQAEFDLSTPRALGAVLAQAVMVCSLSFSAGANAQQKVTLLPPPEKRYAILVGIDKYKPDSHIRDLPGAKNDVVLLNDLLLRKLGFLDANIRILTPDTKDQGLIPFRQNFLDVYAEIFDRMEPGSLLVVAFVGHGITKRDPRTKKATPILLMWNSKLSDPLADDRSLAVTTLQKIIQTGEEEQVVLLLDACQTDPDPSHELSHNLMDDAFVKELQFRAAEKLHASLTFFATSPNHYAFIDNTAQRGYFTQAISDAVTQALSKKGSSPLSLDLFISNVIKAVKAESKGEQEPLPDVVGYDQQKLILVDPNQSQSATVRHSIQIFQAETLDSQTDCTRPFQNGQITVDIDGAKIDPVAGTLGCTVTVAIPDPPPSQMVRLSLTRHPIDVVQDSPTEAFDATLPSWKMHVHYLGPSTRISVFGLGDPNTESAGSDFAHFLYIQVSAIAGLSGRSEELQYLGALSPVQSNLSGAASFGDKVDYLNRTNSAEVLWGEQSGDTVNLHALVRSDGQNAKIINASVTLGPDLEAYKKAQDVTIGLVEIGLLQDAIHNNKSEAVQVLQARIMQSLEHVSRSADLEEIYSEIKAATLPAK